MKPTSYEDPQIELAWRLLEKSSTRRAGYANRAGVILAADALIAAAIAFPLDGGDIPRQAYAWPALLAIATVGFLLLLTSIYYSLLAMLHLSPRTSIRQSVDYPKDGPSRLFISPSDTFASSPSPRYEEFEDEFLALQPGDLLRILLGELYIDMKLQKLRFRHLQRSAVLLVPAALAAIVINVLRVVFYLL